MMFNGAMDTGTAFSAGLDFDWQFQDRAFAGWFAGPGIKVSARDFTRVLRSLFHTRTLFQQVFCTPGRPW